MRLSRTSLALLLVCGFIALVSAIPHAERHVAAALRRDSQMTSLSTDDSDNIALLETDLETATETQSAAAALTEQCSANNASESGPRILSCCSGFLCPYENAVCCGGTSHCCPSGTVCAVACANCPPICRPPGMANNTATPVAVPADTPAPPAPEPVKHRVVKLEVLPSDSMAKTMRANEQAEKEAERAAQRAQEEQTKKRHEEFHKKLLEAAKKKREARSATEKAEADKREKEIKKIRAIMNIAINHPDFDQAPNITVNFSSSITSDVAQVKDKDVVELDQQDDDAAMTGHPWPPMAALLNDGLGGIWVRVNNIDWLGFGLMRNGTINRVSNIEDCKLQCEALIECRMFKYVRNTQECWLDSAVAKRASACPLVDGKRECESWIKKNQRWDANYEYGVTSVKDKDWKIVNQQNWVGVGDPKAGGRLIRNGRRNIVSNLSECISQCAEEKYCRAFVYFRPNGECWLSSAVAEQGTRCARRLGRRDCISQIKRKTNPERPEAPVAEIKVSGTKEHQAITIENSGNDKKATTLSINLPQN